MGYLRQSGVACWLRMIYGGHVNRPGNGAVLTPLRRSERGRGAQPDCAERKSGTKTKMMSSMMRYVRKPSIAQPATDDGLLKQRRQLARRC